MCIDEKKNIEKREKIRSKNFGTTLPQVGILKCGLEADYFPPVRLHAQAKSFKYLR